MTAPVNNANFATPTPQESRQTAARRDPDADARGGGQISQAAREDSVTLSGQTTEPAADAGIQTRDAARALLERIKQLLTDNPAGAVRAHGNIDPQSAAGTLSKAA